MLRFATSKLTSNGAIQNAEPRRAVELWHAMRLTWGFWQANLSCGYMLFSTACIVGRGSLLQGLLPLCRPQQLPRPGNTRTHASERGSESQRALSQLVHARFKKTRPRPGPSTGARLHGDGGDGPQPAEVGGPEGMQSGGVFPPPTVSLRVP